MKRKFADRDKGNEVLQSITKKKPKSEDWTTEQDDFIKSEMVRLSKRNWKTISKKLSKKFKNSGRSFLDCKSRWEFLTSPQNTWTQNELLVLLLGYYRFPGNWSYISSLLPNKLSIKTHFVNKARKAARKIKSKTFVLNDCSHFKIIKRLFLLKFIWDEYTNKTSPDISEIIKTTELKESDCAGLITSSKGWTKMELDKYLHNFYYSIISSTIKNSDNSLNDLIHERKEVLEENNVKYCWIPFNLNGRELYLLGRYNI